jgi:hypothetical protein
MFDEPEDNDRGDENAAERAADPAERAKEKFDEFRMHAELAAVFEGKRKFDAALRAGLDADIARDVQRTIAWLEKAKTADIPLLPPDSTADAIRLLTLPATADLPTNDYHIHRRPGEVMVVRWLAGGDEIEQFYTRLQAHFDAALTQFREDERQALGWKQDEQSAAYLKALDAIDVKLADRYLRDPIRKHNIFVLSTQAADEIDIIHLATYLMSVDPAELVGSASAPPEDGATERDRAWFFKLFSLRGVVEGVERMCFFTFLQKSDDGDW